MDQWLIHSLIATAAFGAMATLYKIPAARGYDKSLYSFIGITVSMILSYVFFFKSIQIGSFAMYVGLFWGIGYAVLTVIQMEILKKLDTHAVLPITSLGSNVLVVLIGIFFFQDTLSLPQLIGIALTFFAVGLYNGISKNMTFKNGLIISALSIIVLSTVCKFLQKFGTITGDLENFIFWQIFFASLAALVICLISHRQPGKKIEIPGNLIGWGLFFGVLNFIGQYEIIMALSSGPFSLVYTIHCFYLLITSILAWLFFNEKLTKKHIGFILLAIVTIVLIRIG